MRARLKILANYPLQRCVQHCTTAIHTVDNAGLQLAEETAAAETDRQIGALQAFIIFPDIRIVEKP